MYTKDFSSFQGELCYSGYSQGHSKIKKWCNHSFLNKKYLLNIYYFFYTYKKVLGKLKHKKKI